MKQVQIPKRVKLLTLVVTLIWAIAAVGPVAYAQSAGDYTVEVVVADPGASQRSSAYWLALDNVLRRNMPEGSIDEASRKEIFRDPSRYVQSYRYRKFDPAADAARTATRKVREGAPADSVVAVTLPASLISIIRQQLTSQSIETVEEIVVPGSGKTLALIAVEQDGQQFLIGGERGKKFQTRLMQLGLANNFTVEFPLLDSADTEIVSPTSVFYGESASLNLLSEKYNSTNLLIGALVRLSAEAWQSDWTLSQPGQSPRNVSLTTQTLDEALMTAITEMSQSGNQPFANTSYLTDGAAFQRSGVALRVQNINSLGQYQQALSLLKAIDPGVITEALEPGVTVFRAAALDPLTLQQALAQLPQFSQVSDATAGADLSYFFR